MAKLINIAGNKSNKSKLSFYRNMTLIMGLICAMDFVYWAWFIMVRRSLENGIIYFLIFAVVLSISGYATSFLGKKYSIIKSGLTGEQRATNVLNDLPNEYTILQNVSLQKDDRRTELDNLVLSPYGIFIVEVKNHNGVIEGKKEDILWTQTKVGRGGTVYTTNFKNPLKQLNFQIYLLSAILKSANINVWIDGYVLFTGAESVTTDSDNVFSTNTSIYAHIIKEQKMIFSEAQLNMIKNALINHQSIIK